MFYRNLLLIDDDEDDQEIFVTALHAISKDVNFTGMFNGREALDRLIAGEIKPDIIFLDLNMPVMNGQQFLTEIKKIQSLKEIPVFIFSTSAHKPTIDLMLDLGAANFITKPHNFNQLIAILRPYLNPVQV